MKNWNRDHVQLAIAAAKVRRKLRDLANCATVFDASPLLSQALLRLAGQLGIPLGMDPTQSPRFYAEVLTSRELLARVLLTKFPDPRRPAAGDSIPLLAILRVRGGIWGAKSAADSLDRGVRKLRRRVSTRPLPKSSVRSGRSRPNSAAC